MNKNGWQRGEGNLTGIIILAFLIIFMVVSPKNKTASSNPTTGWSWVPGTTLSSATHLTTSQTNSGGPVTSSSYTSDISIGSGNASYSYQPYEEYVTIENHGQTPTDITGWQLKNGKDKRPYYQGGVLQRFSADIALIPQATTLLSPSGNNSFQNVILKDGETAIVTTGMVNVQTPYKITSFKENMCTGYIEALSDYAFTPALSQNCPQPRIESGIENLDGECRTFINSISTCRTPEFDAKTPDGKESCSTCVNGKILTSVCAAFIKEHYSYKGCVANHADDTNFSGRTWRIFLGRGWEMWAKEYETIELYDRLGKLVNFQNY